ncbi:MAG: FMN-binding glutamate synthase family protein [Candidatus Aenigmatarchaeota archaeon]|nr:MAG: FMN-binding glutamate synthase family protein [Candidatus Aenigmarchaeota archaeon]
MNWILEIQKRALNPKPPVSGGRCNFEKPSFDDLVFIPAQLAKTPIDYFRGDIETKTIIGRKSKKPLVLSTPILAAAMSFGALSKEAKIAIAKATAAVGTATNTGEGGMLPEERKEAKLLIAQYSTARFGVDENYLKSGDAIEIKIGQGAKPGQGGLLPKEKVTKEIARVRKLKKIETLHSPPNHPDIRSITDLKKKVTWLRDITGGRPIIIKLGSGDVRKDVELAVKADPDAIAIDGMSGGTGAAPEIMLHCFGIPATPAIAEARETLDRLDAKQELIAGGGLNTGLDFAKALALGADAVFIGFPLMIAMGCQYCRQCYKGKCPKGIASQTPKFRRNLHVKRAATSIINYLKSCTEEIKMAAAATGKRNVHDLNKNDLRSLDETVSRITGVKMV